MQWLWLVGINIWFIKGTDWNRFYVSREDSLLPSSGRPDAVEDGEKFQFLRLSRSQFQKITHLLEGDIAHFEATPNPVGD